MKFAITLDELVLLKIVTGAYRSNRRSRMMKLGALTDEVVRTYLLAVRVLDYSQQFYQHGSGAIIYCNYDAILCVPRFRGIGCSRWPTVVLPRTNLGSVEDLSWSVMSWCFVCRNVRHSRGGTSSSRTHKLIGSGETLLFLATQMISSWRSTKLGLHP